jgi:meso-butanediol dehydrogenase/(S,S)-butanediol dehydrogenase/diacetyl reductase
MTRLTGRRAVVTGGSKGLGRRIVEALLAEGASVAALARPGPQLDSVADEIGDRGLAVSCDIRSAVSVRDGFKRAALGLGGIDILINNAALCSIGRIEEVSDDLVLAEVETNLLGVIWCARAAIPHLRASGRGHIVSVTSEAVDQSPAFLGVYSATKAGVEALSGSLRREVRPDGTRVSILRVGRMTESSLQQAWDPQVRERFLESVRASGVDEDNGQPMQPETAAKALIDLLCLPDDGRVDLVTVRGR